MTSYAAFLWKFSLAPSALAIKTLTCSLKCRKSAKNFRLRLRRTEKQSTFLGVVGFAPLWKIFCGRPCPWTSAGKRAGAEYWYLLPWNLKLMTSYTVPLQNLNFSLAPSALALNTLKFSLGHPKFDKVSTFCRRCAKNWRFGYSGLQIPSILSKKLNICKNFRLLILTRKKQH